MRRTALFLLLCAACTSSRELRQPLGATELRELNDAFQPPDSAGPPRAGPGRASFRMEIPMKFQPLHCTG